jgi:hypothetical protein
MDGALFDRITKTLVNAAPRRNAVKALAGIGLAAVTTDLGVEDASARCQKIGQRCGGNKTCCNKSGLVRCENFPQGECLNPGKPAGMRCCGQEGAPCDPKFGTPTGSGPGTYGNCSCCAPLFCGKRRKGVFRCQAEDT